MSELRKEDLWDLRNNLQEEIRTGQLQIREEIRDGFTGVHRRQDLTNGRISATEAVQREHGVLIKNLERIVFHRRRVDWDPSTDAEEPVLARPVKTIASHVITDRDVKIVWLTLAAVVGAAEVGLRVVPLVIHFVTGH